MHDAFLPLCLMRGLAEWRGFRMVFFQRLIAVINPLFQSVK